VHDPTGGRRRRRPPGEQQGEVLVVVGPDLRDVEAGCRQLGAQPGKLELRAGLGQHLFALRQVPVQPERADRHDQLAARTQPHLDPPLGLVEARDVLEVVRVEVGAELTGEDVEQVLVERRRHARRVVVRAHEPVAVLHEVRAEQEEVAGTGGPVQSLEEGPPRLRREVADRAAEEGDQPVAGLPGERAELVVEVGDQSAHRDGREVRRDLLRGVAERLLGDVERDEQCLPTARSEPVEEQSRLARVAGAELDEGADQRQLPGALLEDPLLGARRVVLRELGDGVEERAALLVVEPLRRDGDRRHGEPSAHVVGEAAGLGDRAHLDGPAAHERASRRPENAQRAGAGKKLR
jgi:hypothetical protein